MILFHLSLLSRGEGLCFIDGFLIGWEEVVVCYMHFADVFLTALRLFS